MLPAWIGGGEFRVSEELSSVLGTGEMTCWLVEASKGAG